MRALVACVALTFVTLHAQGPAPEPALDTVLARAGGYVLDYQKRLTGIVAEEQYAQVWRKNGDSIAQQRTLRSDVLLTQPTGSRRAILFRDVFEVDGRALRDRDERLTQLFLAPSASASAQIVRIISESARYNIGDIARTINTPTLALVFLDPQYQPRFRFTRTDDRTPETMRGKEGSGETWTAPPELMVIAYQEVDRNTMIGKPNGGGIPSRGRYWINAATGAVVMSELELADTTLDAVIDVRYGSATGIDVTVPAAMRERYKKPRSKAVIDGEATYSRFRRFQVTSTETLADQNKK